MSKLSQIIYKEKSILEKEAIIEPIQKEIDILSNENEILISEFLESVMVKRKKYYTESHIFEWICWTKIFRDDIRVLFDCEFKDNSNKYRKKSIIFKECLEAKELYDVFKHTIYYKELVRDSSLESILDDK